MTRDRDLAPVPDIGPRRKRERRQHIDVAASSTERPGSRPIRQCAVLGAGGHGREIADIIRAVADVDGSLELLGIADDGDPDRLLMARSGFRYLGKSEAIARRSLDIYLGIGYPAARRAAGERLKVSTAPPALVHPSVLLGSAVFLGLGSVLAQGVVLTTNVSIGEHSHLNVGATISHDCVVGDFVTICPGVTITGSVTVGDGVFVGAGATILPGITIGSNAIVGAGAVVADDVPDDATVVGVPARRLD